MVIDALKAAPGSTVAGAVRLTNAASFAANNDGAKAKRELSKSAFLINRSLAPKVFGDAKPYENTPHHVNAHHRDRSTPQSSIRHPQWLWLSVHFSIPLA